MNNSKQSFHTLVFTILNNSNTKGSYLLSTLWLALTLTLKLVVVALQVEPEAAEVEEGATADVLGASEQKCLPVRACTWT
jgi:hypothetical protein